MKHVFAYTSAEAFGAMREHEAFITGREATVPFAELHDDGTGTYPDLESDADLTTSQEGVDLPQQFRARHVAMLQHALHRDATYRSATRGRLLRHGLRMKALAPFDAGYVLYTAGL